MKIDSIKKEIKIFNPNGICTLLIACIIVITYFYFLQFSSSSLADRDGYFHIKFSQLMYDHGIIYKLPWMQYTIFKDYFRDHHFLQHVLYIPFTFCDLIKGAKWAALFFASLAGISFYFCLRLCNVRYCLFWTFAFLASSSAFLYRISMLRVQSISLALMLLSIFLIIKKRYKSLSICAFLFVWLYDAFPLLIVITLIFFLCELFIEKRADYRLLIYLFSGILGGIVINPFFPENITSYLFNLIRISSDDTSIRIGQEWYPYATLSLLKDAGFVFIVFFGVIGLLLGGYKKRSHILTSMFFVSCFFMFLLFKSRRYIEYWPPFAMIFCAFGISELVNNNEGRFILKKSINKRIFLFLVVSITGYFIISNFIIASKQMKEDPSKDFYKGAALWLKERTEPETIVFNTDWDDFPYLFFYNTHNYYIVGLDPNYMYKYNSSLYRTWQAITKGKVENPHKIIVEKFNSYYVLTDNKHEDFIKQANNDPYMKVVYKDKFCRVYMINNK